MCQTAEFGVMNEMVLPSSAVAELPQVRSHYDADDLADLATSIPCQRTDDGRLQFELINPPTVARFTTTDTLAEYLDAYKSYYGGDDMPDAGELPRFNGAWHVRINGHRRARAITALCVQYQVEPDDAYVISKVLDAPSFEQARRNQFLENTYAKLTPDEAAAAIEREYDYRRRLHPDLQRGQAVRDTAEFLGYGESKVRDALLYTTVSDTVRSFVGKGLTYTNVVSLARLRDAYYKKTQNADAAEQDVETYFRQILLRRLQNTSPAKLDAMITAKIHEVNRTADYQQDALLVVDEMMARRVRREHTDRQLADTAVLAAELTADRLTPAQLARLAAIVDQHQTPPPTHDSTLF